MKRFFHNNSLSIVLLTIFFVSLVGMSLSGWSVSRQEAADRNQPIESYGEYIVSGDFIEGVFENWESEFLQMWALVVLTIWLRQKGADDSKLIRGKTPQDARSRYSLLRADTVQKKLRATGHFLYSHSFSLVLFLIFVVSFVIHAIGGSAAYNQDAIFYNKPRETPLSYVGTSQFWYESLQNWQSEFLAVGVLLLLSIKLRERGSPESKPVGKRYDHQTGS